MVSRFKLERDIAGGIFEAVKQQAFRRGADRKDLDTLLRWSMARDLRATPRHLIGLGVGQRERLSIAAQRLRGPSCPTPSPRRSGWTGRG